METNNKKRRMTTQSQSSEGYEVLFIKLFEKNAARTRCSRTMVRGPKRASNFHPEAIMSGFITLDGSVGQGLPNALKAFKGVNFSTSFFSDRDIYAQSSDIPREKSFINQIGYHLHRKKNPRTIGTPIQVLLRWM